jgi:hypothetical protein
MNNRRCLLAAAAILAMSCASRRVPPANPEYLLRAGEGWVDLRPRMQVRVENAYYRAGMPKRGLANFLGTEIVHYQVRPSGALRQLEVESRVGQRPPDQPPVDELLPVPQRRFRHHRYFYQVLLDRKSTSRSAVLISASSQAALDQLKPEIVCATDSRNCTVFPEACTVSLEIEIVVNGQPRTVLWGSALRSVAPNPKQLEVLRLHAGRAVPVEIDAADPNALRLPLLPGDRITWR